MIGFFDESSPQTTSNTQKLWSTTKPVVTKNTTRIKANTLGFYAIKGHNTIDFKEHSKKRGYNRIYKTNTNHKPLRTDNDHT